jgi:putative ABC transport system ATP-binding protein
MPEEILVANKLTRTYGHESGRLTVLSDVSFSLSKGDALAVVGPSGSGKTTLLGLCAGLDRCSDGSVVLCGKDLGPLSEDERAELRNEHVGFVFQSFHLIPTLTALENVMVPLELRGTAKDVIGPATKLLERVGLKDRMKHYPAQLSGGECQRVALARAYVNHPDILFADEPTGNLDNSTGSMVEDLLFELNEAFGTTLVLVTHDLELAERCKQTLQLKGGRTVVAEGN